LLLLFAISGVAAFSMFFNVESAQADGTLKVCVYGKLYDSNKGFYNERLRANLYWNGTYVSNTGSSCYTLSGPAGTYNGTITAKKPSYTSNGVNYHFYDKSRNNFTLRDGWTTRINFYLTAKNGGVRFYTYDCKSNGAIGGATMHFESASVNTDSGGHYTLNGIYPGIYRYLYASKSGYANSDANYIPISSEFVYSGSNARFCLKPLKGSVAGRVTVCGFSSQGIGNADMLYRGNLLVNNATNSNGYYSYTDIAAGTYDRISFGGVSGFNNSSSQNITINPNTTTTANFCLWPTFNSLSYSWLPANGTNYYGFAGKIDYKFFINNSTVGSYDNVTVEFLFDGGVIRRVTKDVLRFSNTEFAYDYWNFFIPLGSHSVGAKVYWNGNLVLNESRTITVRSFAGGWMAGDVTDCESEAKIPSARVSCGGDFTNTNAVGHYSLRLPVGNYSGAHASKTGYEDSVSRNVTIKANETTNTNFCMNRETGAFVSRVLRNGLPVNNARVYWDDPSAGANNLLLGTTNSNGFLSGINVAAGTYNGIYASAFSRDSVKKTVIIRANQTTRVDFTIPSTPVPTLNATLNANPSSGNAPLTSNLSTAVGGTASGTITYSNQSCGGGIISNVSGGSFRCRYNNPGTYTARIRVRRQGLTRNATRNITVSATPTLNATLNANPSSGTAPLNGVDLTAGASGTASGTVNYTFYCNRSDAGTNITSGYVHKKDGTNQNPYTANNVCSYASPGIYTAKVIIERGGLAAERRTTITVNSASNQRPVAFIDQPASDQSISVGDSVSFTGHGTDSDGNISGYEWRVGNCNTGSQYSALASFTRNFGAVGSYQVYFRVRDDKGAWSVNCPFKLITVSAVGVNNPPFVEALPDAGLATVGTNAGINCGSTFDPDGDSLTYQWTQTGGPAVTINNSNQCNASFTVGSTAGANYAFNLSVSDGINPAVSDQADITSVAVPCLCNTGCEVNTCAGTNCNDSCGNSVCPGTKDCSSSKNWKEVAP